MENIKSEFESTKTSYESSKASLAIDWTDIDDILRSVESKFNTLKDADAQGIVMKIPNIDYTVIFSMDRSGRPDRRI